LKGPRKGTYVKITEESPDKITEQPDVTVQTSEAPGS
jgi:hypothetical protein